MPIHTVNQSPWLGWSAPAAWGWKDTSFKNQYVEMGMEKITDLVDTLKDYMAANNYDPSLVSREWKDSNMGHKNEYVRPGGSSKEQVCVHSLAMNQTELTFCSRVLHNTPHG